MFQMASSAVFNIAFVFVLIFEILFVFVFTILFPTQVEIYFTLINTLVDTMDKSNGCKLIKLRKNTKINEMDEKKSSK